MRRFFSNDTKGANLFLDAEESRHLQQVLRLKIGDELEVVNGKGELFQCQIVELRKRSTELKIIHHTQVESTPNTLWMAVAPTKNINRWEWFLEKATEIGIGRITPLLCKNSERKVLKRDRQERILKEAMKQSKQLFLPQLDELSTFDELLQQVKEEEKFIAHCYDGKKESLKNLHEKGKKALILIGPEGDFDLTEVEKAMANGFKAIHLGESRLRTETAAIIACHSIQLIDA